MKQHATMIQVPDYIYRKETKLLGTIYNMKQQQGCEKERELTNKLGGR